MINKDLLEANLIKLLGLELLPLEKKVSLLQQAAELVQKNLMVRLLQSLPEEKQEQFLNLVGSDEKEKEKEKFLAEHFPNLEEMINEEIIKIKEGLKAAVEA